MPALDQGRVIVSITNCKSHKRQHHAHEDDRHRAAKVRFHQGLHKDTVWLHVEGKPEVHEGFHDALREQEHQKDDSVCSGHTQEQKSFPGFAVVQLT